MKNLNTITIGNITALTALKALTVISFCTYLLLIFANGFFALETFFTFLLSVALFMLCTHRPKPTKKQQLQNRINKRLLEISQNKRFNLSKNLLLIILLFISFNSVGQTVPVDNNKIQKDTVIKKINYKIYIGKRGGRYYYKLSGTTNKYYKRYIKK